MVNFNNETTVGQPAIDIERVLILQRRDAVIEAIERYISIEEGGSEAAIYTLKSRLASLYLQLYGMLYRRYKDNEKFQAFMQDLRSSEYTRLIKAFEFMSGFLDDIKLTRVDNTQQVDTKRWVRGAHTNKEEYSGE